MELDDLKKSWAALDSQLQKSPMTDTDRLAELIATHKNRTRRSLKRLSGWQLTSVIMGIVALLFLIAIAFEIPKEAQNAQTHIKMMVFTAFIAITIIGGLWWDFKAYRWIKSIRVDEMPVVEVSRRVITFKRWVGREVITICIWALLFNGLYYWLMGFYNAPALLQALIIAVCLVCDALIIYLLYKKVLYKHLNDIDKNIDELKDICTE